MGKKGLSRDEKLQRLQELLHESKTAMTVKELETKAYKEKGIVAKTVAEIAGELVADNLICCEKIGISNYYWSFPSQALIVRRQKKVGLDESIKAKKRTRETLQEEEDRLDAERDDSERATKLQTLADLREEEADLDSKLSVLQKNDPELLECYKKDIKVAKEAVERWTDNLFTTKKIFTNKSGRPESDFDKAFETQNMQYDD
jgi:hypothetical protein